MTEAVAESFASYGISAIVAVKGSRSYLQLIENIGYLAYPWTSAAALGEHDITEKHVLEVAGVMATMHCANLTAPALEQVPAFLNIVAAQRAAVRFLEKRIVVSRPRP